ncbi:TPA: endonuclease domain-containing protein, partial [Mannheimia haemolytica]|nr:endonuclease domain-containing protein [Mannheimia haemolytica]
MKAILCQRAKQLRTNMTEAEKVLWQALRAKRFLAIKFKRQQVIGNYIVDFVCFSAKLVIELDGSQHLDQQNYDNLRTHFLNGQGFRVLRFWNNQIHSDLEAVLDTIFYEI